MKTLRELNFEYWGRVHDMCEGTNVKPWRCIRYKNGANECITRASHPCFDEIEDLNKVELAVAILEGKPVFPGDVIYRINNNTSRIIKRASPDSIKNHVISVDNLTDCEIDIFIKDSLHTWTSPTKKRTFTLNGIELPCPSTYRDDQNSFLYMSGNYFYFESENDECMVTAAIAKILTEARDKQ